MTQSVSRSYVTQLQECIALAREVSKQPQANQAFAALRDKVAQENPDHARLLELLWGNLSRRVVLRSFGDKLAMWKKNFPNGWQKITYNCAKIICG
uniref:Uncharacterized protein n=1 Tax=Desertifilum tharense IPPAS B-1220 TaxID=1781255 RepID=A0ACD5H328_9CYAN